MKKIITALMVGIGLSVIAGVPFRFDPFGTLGAGGQVAPYTYIYAGGFTPYDIKKYNLSDLSFVTNSISYGGGIYSIIQSTR